MKLLGKANWWLPAWLDRLLPDIDMHRDGAFDPPAPVTEAARVAQLTR
jgi:RND superfamily putative drug exporter